MAEHTLALMLAMARHIPQANASTRAGKWEKKKFLGNELRGKTLGIVGLGSIGREVVKRARAFEMRIVAHDPYVTSKIAQDLGVELVDLPALYAGSDYITLHVAATPETQGMLSREAFAQMKTGVRIVNCARGELVDEAALQEAIASGKVAGAALDVFATEPPPAGLSAVRDRGRAGHAAHRRLHRRGAGDRGRAHRRAGGGIPEERRGHQRRQHARALARAVPRAGPLRRRWPSGWATSPRTSPPATRARVRLVYFGDIAGSNTSLLRNAGLAGVLSRSSDRKANLVNAMQIAEQRGWDVAERARARAPATPIRSASSWKPTRASRRWKARSCWASRG